MRAVILTALACAALVGGTLLRLAPPTTLAAAPVLTELRPAGGAGFRLAPEPSSAQAEPDFGEGEIDFAPEIGEPPILIGLTGGRRNLSHLSVDGRMITLGVGDSAAGWRIMAIEPDAVVIEDRNGMWRLRLYADQFDGGESEGR